MMSAVSSVFGISDQTNSLINLPVKRFDIKAKTPVHSQLKNELQNTINNSGLENSIKLEENERGITVHILDDILFSSASADINSNSTDILKRLATLIKTWTNDIRVEGHTDNVPISSLVYASNWHLSVSRALNTAYYLINSEGLSPEKVSIVGFSEYRPVAPNTTPEGRRNNRRVDIVILKK